jgi:phospholipase C
VGVLKTTGRLAAGAIAAFELAACGTGSSFALPGNPAGAQGFVEELGAGRKIDHVIIVVQENRSFDNLFQGAPGADTRSYGYGSTGQRIALKPIGLKTTWDLEHSFTGFLSDCNGRGHYPGTDCRMNGFDQEGVECGREGEPRCPTAHPQYAYVPRKEVAPYFQMASEYVLSDRMFVSNLDASSFVSHQYIIAGQASSSVNVPGGGPWGCRGQARIATLTQQRTIGPDISPCFDNPTLADELDSAKLSWKYYTASLDQDGGLWSAFQAIKHIYDGPDWKKDVISPQTRFFKDVRRGALPAVTWITPTCANSDHAGCDSDTGPQWVASLVNAVGESPYWKSSVIFIFWDDPGGWYDHVAPKKLDYDGLGFRVPLLVVSPYAKKGYVSHASYEHGSLLRFIEDRFGLGRLAATDARARSPVADCFDFGQAPRKFVPIVTKMTERDFERQPLDRRIPDSQ